MSIHSLTIIKRAKSPDPIPVTRFDPEAYVETDSKATCSCGWQSDWKSTEELTREEYGKHKFSDTICLFEIASFYRATSTVMSPTDRQKCLDVINGKLTSAYVEVGNQLFYLTSE